MKPMSAFKLDLEQVKGKYVLTPESSEYLNKFFAVGHWFIGQPKFDGIRGIKFTDRVMSKRLKPLPNVKLQDKLQHIPVGTDFEVCHESGDFNDAQSVVMSRNADIDKLTLHIFDTVKDLAAVDRMAIIQDPFVWSSFMKNSGFQNTVTIASCQELGTVDQVNWYLEACLNMGLEGSMLRLASSHYKHGQATKKNAELIKLKPFIEADAEVIGWVEQQQNNNEAKPDELGRSKRSSHKANKVGKGTLGALLCKDTKTGEEFSVDGFDDDTAQKFWDKFGKRQQRIALPNAYRFIRYSYQLKKPGEKSKKPRHPKFIHFRDARDIA